MAAINPTTLDSEAKCYYCLTPATPAKAYKLALIARSLVAVDPAADTSVAGNLEYGKCYGCLGMSEFEIVELALLDKLSQALAS